MSDSTARRLQGYLPDSWGVAVASDGAGLVVRAPDGSRAVFRVLARKQLDARGVLNLRQRLDPPQGTLVVATFLGPRTRELLEQAGASYMDDHGNVRIALDRPAIYVRLEGAQRNPARPPQPLASLKGPASARVVRALCDFLPPFGVRKLARRAEASAASVSRVVAFLEREALLERQAEEVANVNWAGLLRRWALDYQFFTSNEVSTFLEPRGMDALAAKLRHFQARCVLTGSIAANRKAPVAPARSAAIYVREIAEAAQELKLRPVDSGGNVFLVRPFSGVAFSRTWTEEGLTFAALSQVAADLLTSPGRGPAEGEELIGWMTSHVGVWRS